MRFVSERKSGYKVYAVSGTHVVSFAIDFDSADTKGLLGFAVERQDHTAGHRAFMPGFKVFKETSPLPDQHTAVSTYDQPVQSFVWDDFTARPEHKYTYYFYPLKGKPGKIDHSAPPVPIDIVAEPLHSPTNEQDVFFNRGVASSQAFARRFHDQAPDNVQDPTLRQQMFDWLGGDLERALLAFISQAQKGDTLLACMYEFHYQPVVDAFKQAIDRGVQVRIIIDAKNNAQKFPRTDNLQAIKAAHIGAGHIIQREANPDDIQHNKFIVFLKGSAQLPTAVWTGSTNVSEGGIFGQTNVGHWVRRHDTAKAYQQYWQLLSQDPGGQAGDTRAQKLQKNQAYKQAVVALRQDITAPAIHQLPPSTTPIFSPRTTGAMLQAYAALLDSAKTYAAITLAFGVADVFKTALENNTPKDHLTFLLLEKPDQPASKSKTFVKLTAKNNVYEAWGSYIKDPLYRWTKETNTALLKLNQHVMYIHSKFLLVDPLGDQPIVVSGSANFSESSTVNNDENMMIVKGNKRVADIYFTEFNRLFNHYYFRSIYESHPGNTAQEEASLFLQPDDSWLAKYQPGTLRYKRVAFYRAMSV